MAPNDMRWHLIMTHEHSKSVHIYYSQWLNSMCGMWRSDTLIHQENLRSLFNHLTPNGHYMGRTAQLTSRRCILYIYSTNIHTEYFKHAA